MTDLLAVTGVGLVLPQGPPPVHYIEDSAIVPARFTPEELRGTGRLARLALTAVDAAWTQAGLEADPRLGLVVGTALGDLHETSEFLRGIHEHGSCQGGSLQFQRSIHGDLAAVLARLYGLSGYCLTVSEGLHTGEAALYAAALAVRSERCDRCLCVAADMLSGTPLLARQLMRPELAVGEAAAAIVLEHPVDADQRDAEILGALHRGDLARAQRKPVEPIAGLGLCGAGGLVRVVRTIELGVRGR